MSSSFEQKSLQMVNFFNFRVLYTMMKLEHSDLSCNNTIISYNIWKKLALSTILGAYFFIYIYCIKMKITNCHPFPKSMVWQVCQTLVIMCLNEILYLPTRSVYQPLNLAKDLFVSNLPRLRNCTYVEMLLDYE